MTNIDPLPAPVPPSAGRPAQPSGPPWLVILGLASLALLLPLTALLGFGDGAARALTLLGLIALAWIGVVGFAPVRMPVLTLTLTGTAYGVITLLIGTVFGTADGPIWALLVALALDAFWGMIAGLLAFGIQRLRRRA